MGGREYKNTESFLCLRDSNWEEGGDCDGKLGLMAKFRFLSLTLLENFNKKVTFRVLHRPRCSGVSNELEPCTFHI